MDFSYALELADRIQNTETGTALAESALAFPVIEGIHLIGLSVSVGLIFLIDLRLLGVFLRDVPLTQVLHELRNYVLSGFAAVLISGILLFWSEASVVVASPAFPFKLLFIVLAGVNALYFEIAVAQKINEVGSVPAVPPLAARGAGLASIVLWTLVIICGRLIPYLTSW